MLLGMLSVRVAYRRYRPDQASGYGLGIGAVPGEIRLWMSRMRERV